MFTWEEHYSMQEQSHIGMYYQKLEETIKKFSSPYNKECFPIASFGAKHADLNPEGCTGIRTLYRADPTEDFVEVQVGGHCCFSPTEDEEKNKEILKVLQKSIFDLEFDGEDWYLSFTQTLRVPVTWDDDISDEDNYQNMALKIIDASKKKCRLFSDKMVVVTEWINNI